MSESHHPKHMRKLRALTLGLIVSGALNIGLVITTALIQEKKAPQSIFAVNSKKGKNQESLSQILGQMKGQSYQKMLSFLTNKEIAVDNFSKRDLALALLVSEYYFAIDSVIEKSRYTLQRLSLSDGSQIQVLKGLNSSDFDKILKFAYSEKWPLSAEGFYNILKSNKKTVDGTFYEAFFKTPQVQALNLLLEKTEIHIENSKLFALIIGGSFDMLDLLCKQQMQFLDLSINKRRSVLLNYLASGSVVAAEIFLAHDAKFLDRLEDSAIVALLELFPEKNEDVENFCRQWLKNPRSDLIAKTCLDTLYRFNGQTPFEPFPDIVKETKTHLQSEKPCDIAKEVVEPKVFANLPKFKEHVVKEGESLWRISRAYNVKVDEIVKVNDMDKDRLFPGMILRIPEAN